MSVVDGIALDIAFSCIQPWSPHPLDPVPSADTTSSCSHSLASNCLGGIETEYVNKSKVQGSSFKVGAKVTYEGREMTVSQAPDRDREIKMFDFSGILAVASCLPECKSLTSLKCAAFTHKPPTSLRTQALRPG